MAFDAFLKIDGLDGECQDAKHANWIEVLSFSHGVSQPSAGSRSSGGAASGQRCDHQDFSVVKTLDKTSPKLNLFCSNGKHIKEVKLELCRATEDKNKYMEYKMDDVIISSVQPGGSAKGGEALPLEQVSFNYGKIVWTYTTTDHATGKAGGNVTANWSVIKNEGQ
jgi:type VI secretion system secreted protein Hcp